MRTPITITVAAAGALLVGCQHPAPSPGGTGQYAEPPTGVVDALPEGVYAGAVEKAVACESGDFSACGQLAYAFEHGQDAPYTGSHGGHGDDHGDDHAEDDHGDDHGDEHAEDDHGDDHGDEHAEDDHGDDHGDGHGHGSYGIGIEPNPEMAETLYRASCEAGWETSCVAVARMRLTMGGSAEMMEAESLMDDACDAGMTEACYELAGLYLDGTLPGSVRAAMPYLHEACAMGLADACADLSERIR